jgi:hypothetical protein
MARRGIALVAGSVAGLFIVVSCAEEGGDGGDSGDGGPITGPNNGEFRDVNDDGTPDPLDAGDFGGGAKAVTESDVNNARSASCTGWAAEPEPTGSSIFFVVDASSSMRATANGTGSQSKWVVTRDALIDTVEALPDSTAVGLLGYPNKVVDGQPGDSSRCVNVDALIAPSLLGVGDFRQTIVDGLNAIETQTCTPTHDAYSVAVAEYNSLGGVVGQKYILLMTDGTPTLTLGCEPGQCAAGDGYEQPVIDAIREANEQYNIKTFVLGSPGSEEHMDTGLDNRWWLSEAAEAGGTSAGNGCRHDGEPYCHFDMTQAADFTSALRDALDTIAGQVVSCDYAIPTPPADLEIDAASTNLFLFPGGADPIQLLQSVDPACDQGWYFDEATGHVTLCSGSCALAQSDPQLRLELMFGCQSEQTIR